MVVPATLDGFIRGGGAALEGARTAIDFVASVVPGSARKDLEHDLKAVKLHAPWVPRGRIALAAGNYATHAAAAMTVLTKTEVTPETMYRQAKADEPWGFWKVAAAVPGPDEGIPLPKRARLFDYEGEVAIVIGAPAKDVVIDSWRRHVWGITLLNDWSIRNDMGPTRLLNYNLSKNFDGSASVGPCILVDDDVDVHDLDVETRVNGSLRQHYNTAEMVHDYGTLLSHLSRDLTLEPGDMIAGGTGSGTGLETPLGPDGTQPTDRYLKIGDVVEVSSPKIGILRNHIVRP
jgi:acylpyruvate hydrolase